jgi:predicted DNA-binding ribbon-helix-helix protein
MSKQLKRSLSIAGHRTSVSLEPEFWAALNRVASSKQQSVAGLVAAIDQGRGDRNLSSAIRVWVLLQLQVQAAEAKQDSA